MFILFLQGFFGSSPASTTTSMMASNLPFRSRCPSSLCSTHARGRLYIWSGGKKRETFWRGQRRKKNLLGFREKKIYMGFLYIKEKYQGLPLVFYVFFCFSWQSLKATFFQTVPNLCSACLYEHRLKADTSICFGIPFFTW